MKTAPFFALATLLLGAVFFVLPVLVRADIINQPVYSNYVGSSGGNTLFNIGTSTADTSLNAITVVAGAVGGATATFTARITCFANSYSSSQTGCNVPSAIYSNDSFVVSSSQQFLTFTWNQYPIQSGKVYLVEVLSASGQGLWGQTGYQITKQCDYPFTGGFATYCTGTPYFAVNSSINWNALNLQTLPVLFSTSSAALAASSSLWGAFASSTTLAASCNSGNLLGDGICTGFAFLFAPNPNVLNAFFSIPNQLESKFPFSIFYSVQGAFSTLTASSTANLGTVTINFASVDVSTSSAFGPLLPNVTVLSTSTITHFMPAGFWAALQFLIACALWIGLATDIFFSVKNRMHRV